MVKLVDTRDLKSLACIGLRVRFPLLAFGKLVQSVEHGPVKSGVEGSSPSFPVYALVAKLVNAAVLNTDWW